jgi:hypothetical protein
MAASPAPPSPLFKVAQRQASFTGSPIQPSFSRGFHLPSPTPGSPYAQVVLKMPNLPHSNSFPAPSRRESDGETEVEQEQDEIDATPKRRKKIRPVSALPAPRLVSQAWDAPGQSGSGHSPSVSSRPVSQASNHRWTASEMLPPPSPRVSSPTGSTFTSNTGSQVRRLGSFSKKHGRRLSGGFKFGSSSSITTTEHNEKRRGSQPLETVAGSPSKPNRSPARREIPDMQQLVPDDEHRPEARAGSISAPSSTFKTSTVGKTGTASVLTASLSEDAMIRQLEKAKRRQSWGDFVIPKDVMDKQKGIKQDIGALKKIPVHIEGELRICSSTNVNGSREKLVGVPCYVL